MPTAAIPRAPKLWRIKDPIKLMARGQLELPGLGILDSKTDEQAWQELESATSRGRRYPARQDDV